MLVHLGVKMNVNTLIEENLLKSVLKSNARGLHVAACWASEQLLGLDNDDNTDNSRIALSDSIYSLENVPQCEINQVLFATSLLAQGEYQRCSFVLKKDYKNNKIRISSCLGIFLTYYSQYLAGEKLRDQLYSESTKVKVTLTAKQKASEDAPKQSEKVVNHDNNLRITKNNFLTDIFHALLPLYLNCSMDGYLLYLFAVVVRDLVRLKGLPLAVVMRSLPINAIDGSLSVDSSRVDESVDLSTTSVDVENESDRDEEERHASHKTQKVSDADLFNPRKIFVESVALFPWNWSCWVDLAALCVSGGLPVPEWEEILQVKARLATTNTSTDGVEAKVCYHDSSLRAAERTMYVCFLVHVYLEMQRGDLAIQAIDVALPIFPTSLSLRAQIGLALYSARDYDLAQASFEMIRDADPYRVAHIDTYSNILYIKEKHADLSLLAHTLVKVDKYAPETCCVVGNYYSLKGQHDRAITYFKRAIAVDSQYLSAWTLMGHEYIELHNSATAITCYRQALNISESDFRAWYGLGQTYEMLHLYQYASYYFKKAAELRPSDARMWSAVGNCLLKLGSRVEAIAVFERAVLCGDSEGISTRELAKLCRSEGQASRAAEFYLKYLQTTSVLDSSPLDAQQGGVRSTDSMLSGLLYGGSLDAQSKVDADQAEALLFLATYHRATRNFSLAEVFCNRLTGFTGPEGDDAREMLKDIRFSAGDTPLKSPQQTSQRPGSSVHTPGQSFGENSFMSRSISAVGSGRRTSQQFYSPAANERTAEDSRYLNLSYEEVEEEERLERLQRSSLTDSRAEDMTHMSMSSFGDSPVMCSPPNNLQQTPMVPRSMHFNRSRQNAYTRNGGDRDSGEEEEEEQNRSSLQTALFPTDNSLGSAISYRSENSEQMRYREEGCLDDSTNSIADSSAMMSVDSSPQQQQSHSTPPSSRGPSSRFCERI